MAIFGKVSIRVWILFVRIWNSWGCFGSCCVYGTHVIHVVITMNGSTSHPNWERRGCRMPYLSGFLFVAIVWNLLSQYLTLKICVFRFGLGEMAVRL